MRPHRWAVGFFCEHIASIQHELIQGSGLQQGFIHLKLAPMGYHTTRASAWIWSFLRPWKLMRQLPKLCAKIAGSLSTRPLQHVDPKLAHAGGLGMIFEALGLEPEVLQGSKRTGSLVQGQNLVEERTTPSYELKYY